MGSARAERRRERRTKAGLPPRTKWVRFMRPIQKDTGWDKF